MLDKVVKRRKRVKKGATSIESHHKGLVTKQQVVYDREKTIRHGLINGNGLINGTRAGKINGLINGHGKINGRGLINGNGLINGTRAGKINGLINGHGKVNGRGLINGNGIINGARMGKTNGLINGGSSAKFRGMINGNGFTNGLRLRRNRFGLVTQKDIRIGAVFATIFMILLPSVLFILAYKTPPEQVWRGIVIDGNFDDWNSIPKYSEPPITLPANVDIRDYSLNLTESSLSFYVKVRGNLFNLKSPDIFEFFLDVDGDGNTGYIVSENFGCDYRIELFGWDKILKDARLVEFYGTDRLNFSAWDYTGSVNTAIKSNKLEAQIDTNVLKYFEDSFKVMLYARDYEGNEIYSSIMFSRTFGALLVEQEPMVETINGIGNVMKLTFNAMGSSVNVTGLTVTASEGRVMKPSGFTVQAKKSVSKYISLDVTDLSPNTLVTLNLEAVDADRPVRIKGMETRIYVESCPSNITIDGLFTDWTSNINKHTDTSDVGNSNIDISDYSSVKNSTNAFFYLRVKGQMVGGSSVPKMLSMPIPSTNESEAETQPDVVHIPRGVSGEDVTRIFIDSNTSDGLGHRIGDIFADHLIEIKGIYGKITSKAFYKWTFEGWNLLTDELVEVEVDATQLESSIPLAYLGTTMDPEVIFETTDWRMSRDITGMHEGLKSFGQHMNLTIEKTKGSEDKEVLAPTWPDTWASITTDSGTDVTLSDQSLNILQLYENSGDNTYLFIRIRTNQTSGAPDIDNNSWGVYINTDGVAGNDYLIQEEGTTATSFWKWGGSDWNWDGTWTEPNIARVTTMDVGGTTYGVVDIAIRRVLVAELDNGDTIQGFTHDTNNVDRESDTVRNPSDPSPSPNEDVTIPTTIPEFQELLIPIIGIIAIPLIIRRKGKVKS